MRKSLAHDRLIAERENTAPSGLKRSLRVNACSTRAISALRSKLPASRPRSLDPARIHEGELASRSMPDAQPTGHVLAMPSGVPEGHEHAVLTGIGYSRQELDRENGLTLPAVRRPTWSVLESTLAIIETKLGIPVAPSADPADLTIAPASVTGARSWSHRRQQHLLLVRGSPITLLSGGGGA
jgi:hypothetical protein